ncbi:MAG: hypothetical protein AB3N63_02480 [Puniceicoccaceae bacterium]
MSRIAHVILLVLIPLFLFANEKAEVSVVEQLPTLQNAGFEEVVFAVRGSNPHDGHWYANFSHYANETDLKAYVDGAQLAKFNVKSGKVTVLLEDPLGTIRDPVVDYDGKTIVFSYRKGGNDSFHLYEIQSDGSGLKQLTDGMWDDIEPCFLPDGGIMFVSSRCRRWVNCWLTRVANLHRCDRDGSNIRMLSANIEHDNTPWVMHDGRILHTRWEYVDRSQVDFHHLWAMNPDGTNQTVYFGNQHPGGVFIDAKPIPDSNRILFIHSPGHGRKDHGGRIATVSDDNGPDDLASIEFITPDNKQYWDPYPLADGLMIAGQSNKLVLLDMEGNQSVLYSQKPIPAGPNAELAKVGLHEPRPLMKRAREPMIPDRTNQEEKVGRMILTDVYNGRTMEGVERGSIKKLLILEALPKPINYTGGMDPLSYGGTFTLERIMGTVPVEEDGSAFFELPANRSFFFIALDENDNAVKRMRSFTTVMPGETLSCVGCHEERNSTPTNFRADNFLMATLRAPSKFTEVPGVPDVFDFPRDIQPILDKHCVECHQPSKREGGVLLTGDHGPMFSHSYYTLTILREFVDGRNATHENPPPYQIGAVASPLMKKLDGRHYGVVVSPAEKKLIHYWIESGAPYPGTYAALGNGAIGGYYRNTQIMNSVLDWPETPVARTAIQNRCAGCHTEDQSLPKSLQDENQLSFWKPTLLEPQIPRSRHIVFNLSLPDQSLMLLAPLAESAGGYGACREILPDGTYGEPVAVFNDSSDPDYQSILALIEAGKTRLQEVKRFDMPGFQPPSAYLREMQIYGILPADFDPMVDLVDGYALDRQYWDLFEYRPGN